MRLGFGDLNVEEMNKGIEVFSKNVKELISWLFISWKREGANTGQNNAFLRRKDFIFDKIDWEYLK